MSKVTTFNGINIVVRTRDEHCEPHVHVFHLEQGWELRIFFSYVSDEIVEVELLHGKPPKYSVIQAAMNKVLDHLDKCRLLFWAAVQNVCLDHKHIVIKDGTAWAATANDVGALLIQSARYLPSSHSIECTVTNQPLVIAKCP